MGLSLNIRKEELNPFDMLKAMDLDIGDLDMKSVVEEAMNASDTFFPPHSTPPDMRLTLSIRASLDPPSSMAQSPEIQAMMDDPVLLKKALRESPLFENLPGLEK